MDGGQEGGAAALPVRNNSKYNENNNKLLPSHRRRCSRWTAVKRAAARRCSHIRCWRPAAAPPLPTPPGCAGRNAHFSASSRWHHLAFICCRALLQVRSSSPAWPHRHAPYNESRDANSVANPVTDDAGGQGSKAKGAVGARCGCGRDSRHGRHGRPCQAAQVKEVSADL